MFALKMTIFVSLLSCGMALGDPSRPLPPRENPPSISLPAPRTGLPVPWFENFESGAADWTTSGFFHVIADPQVSSVLNPMLFPNLVTLPDDGSLPSAFSGNHAMWYGEAVNGTFIGADFDTTQPLLSGGTSQAPNSGYAITPELDLASVSNATLDFWTWWEVEGVDVPWFDVMYVEASSDAGYSWSPLGGGQLNPLDDVNANANVGYSSGGVGAPGIWVHHVFPLADFVGGPCWIRFRFDTVDQLYNAFRGWFLDDVQVIAAGGEGPQISDVIPSVGQSGDLVQVIGTGFQNGAQITIGDIETTEAIISDVLAQVLVPALAIDEYDVKIVNPDGQFDICHNCFEIIEGGSEPEISDIFPEWTYLGVSEAVSIFGLNFDPAATVQIGGYSPTNLTIVNSSLITCTTPGALGIGFHAVRVENPDGQFDLCVGCFEVREPAELLPPEDVVIWADSPDMVLSWRPVTGDEIRYKVYRSAQSGGEFDELVGITADTVFVDQNAALLPFEVLYYHVRSDR